jgi:hypothetical protein
MRLCITGLLFFRKSDLSQRTPEPHRLSPGVPEKLISLFNPGVGLNLRVDLFFVLQMGRISPKKAHLWLMRSLKKALENSSFNMYSGDTDFLEAIVSFRPKTCRGHQKFPDGEGLFQQLGGEHPTYRMV